MFLQGDRPCIVATADASGLMIAQNDIEFMKILRAADLVTPDSIGVVWAGRKKGFEFKERVSGVDLVDELCRLSSENGYRIFFLGAEPGVAEMAAEKMRLRHPGCLIVGARHGFFPSTDDDLVAAEVATLKPDILFVAMGIPRQEKFIAKTQSIIRARVAMGVGGSLDVFSGRVRRAPVIVQKLHLEWIWRTLGNPKKISKAKHLPKFFWRVLTGRI
jgi:N-acetylglucosaminyldiphosphoundecaprenol N-acetyl-beta-D-mannosaminyltransferase